MPAPPRSFLVVTDIAIRWQVPALDIAGWAIDGEIALSAVLPTVDTADKQIASGIVEIDGADVVALFQRDGASPKPALVRRFRRTKKAEWEWIARPPARWRRRHRRRRDHPACGVRALRTRLGIVRRGLSGE